MLFNLANRYTANGMYQEALNTYQAIVRNKMFAHAGLNSFDRCALKPTYAIGKLPSQIFGHH